MALALIAAAWATDAIHFVLVDRYLDHAENPGPVDLSDPHAWHGGDLAGLRHRLPERGGLWISPVWTSQQDKVGEWGAYHGYWVVDPTTVEPRFGTEAELIALRKDLGQRELWLDLVLNHVGYEAPLVDQHPDWFHGHGDIVRWDDPIEAVTHDVHGLPDLAQEKEEVYSWLRDAALHWVRTVHPTGFRIDAVRHLPVGFLRRLKSDLRKEDPDLQFLGEVFEGDPWRLAARQRADDLDRVFDFPLHYGLVDAVCKDQPMRLVEVLSQDHAYDDPSSLVTFLDNHDVSRIRSACGGDLDKVRAALALLFMLRGSPSLTWGTDLGLSGAHEPENRADMDFSAERPLASFLEGLMDLRAAEPALGRQGRVVIWEASEAQIVLVRGDRVLVFSPEVGTLDSRGLGVCIPQVLTHPEAAAGDLPAGSVAIARCTGPRDPDLEAALAGTSVLVDTLLPGVGKRTGAGPLLGFWNPENAPDDTVRAPLYRWHVYKEVLGSPGAWEWPDSGNRFFQSTRPGDPLEQARALLDSRERRWSRKIQVDDPKTVGLALVALLEVRCTPEQAQVRAASLLGLAPPSPRCGP